MTDSKQSASRFKREFVARTAIARERSGKSQEDIAADLGLSQGTYHKYEKRTPLPHYLVIPFCLACEVTPAWLYTAPVDLPDAAPKPRRRKKIAAKAA